MILQPTSYNLQPRSGFAALLAIVVIGAAALIMAYNSSLLGLGELESGYTAQQGSEAFSLAEGCMEEALRRLRIDPSGFSSMALLSFTGGGSCSVAICRTGPCPGSASPISIEATGCTAGACPATSGYSKKVRASGIAITTTDGINAIAIGKWEEIP